MQDAKAAIEVIRSLRAVRRFELRPIPETVLTDILAAARWTGSAKNTQPWHLIVVRDGQTLETLSTCGRYATHVATAAAAVVLVMDNAPAGLDAGRLAQNIMLAAWAYGVGSCIGSISGGGEERAKQLLAVPGHRSIPLAISLGYPADRAAVRVSTSPEWSAVLAAMGRKDLDELVSWERYGQRS